MIYFAVSLIFFLMVWREYVGYKDRENLQKQNADLMDRLMSTHFKEYAEGKRKLAQKPDDPMTTKERMKGLELAEHQILNPDVYEVA